MTGVHEKLIDQLDHQNLIDQLEEVIAGKDIGRRAMMLRRVTDLFALGSGKMSAEQIALFDDVMDRLVEKIDTAARATFGDVLAMFPDAPPKVIRRLALDDAINVAGPVLSHSGRVDDTTLVEGAKTKSQEHLLAISRRKALAVLVTDVLVQRGNQNVVLSTAGNPGAAFSEFGYSTLVQRSSNDGDEQCFCRFVQHIAHVLSCCRCTDARSRFCRCCPPLTINVQAVVSAPCPVPGEESHPATTGVFTLLLMAAMPIRSEDELSSDERQRLEEAYARLRDAVRGYEPFTGSRLQAGQTMPVLDDQTVAEAQAEVQAAEEGLWRLREEPARLRARPSWASNATLVADWFSDEDAVYDDIDSSLAP